MNATKPIVLCFSGHDPCGGAGIQADIEALISQGCHATSVITALTEQDSHNVKTLLPQAAHQLIDHANTLLADMRVAVIKIGLIGSVANVSAIATVLKAHPHIPVVLDPVLAAGGGSELANQALIECMVSELLPLTYIVTPNTHEARRLTGLESIDASGLQLLKNGCQYALLTGTEEPSAQVSNRLFYDNQCRETYTWQRLPASYHGSGCTLAASLAGFIARGLNPVEAIYAAQDYTWQALQAAYRAGAGQYNPHRLFWTQPQ